MNPIFNELDFRLSEVTRWGIIHTIRKQSVAEHQFNTEKIATGIARLWFHLSELEITQISQAALRHDELEAITNDPPSIIKDCVDEPRLAERYRDLFRTPVTFLNYELNTKIVKIADKIDALFFLYMEKSLGNNTVNSIIVQIEGLLYDLLEPFGYKMWVAWEELRDDVFPHGQYQVNHHDRRPSLEATAKKPVDGECPF